MKPIFFTVGPSQLFPTVPKHLETALRENIPSLSHRSEGFMKINQTTHDHLRKLLGIPKSHHLFYTGSSLEGMERSIQNTVQKYVLHFVNGSFSREFYQISVDLKKDATRIDVPNGEAFDFSSVKIPKKTELICFIHNETSTGVMQPLEDLAALKASNPDVLIAMDMVSSVPYPKVDYSLTDIAFFSVQKGFGLPAGLGVLIVNEKALEKAKWLDKKGVGIGSYHNFLKLTEFEAKFQTRETPNVLEIYLLGKVAEDMLNTGIDTIRKDIDTKSDLIYTFFSNHKEFKPNVEEKFRSKTTIVIDVNSKAAQVVAKLAKKGIIVAPGYGKRKEIHIRIGNFPAHKVSDVKKLLAAV